MKTRHRRSPTPAKDMTPFKIAAGAASTPVRARGRPGRPGASHPASSRGRPFHHEPPVVHRMRGRNVAVRRNDSDALITARPLAPPCRVRR